MGLPLAGLAMLGTAGAGCSSGGPEPATQAAEPPRLSVGQVCPGLFPADGGKALERVLESATFLLRDETRNPDVRAVAQAMKDAYRSGGKIREMPQATCEIAAQPVPFRLATALIRFTAYSKHAGDSSDFPGASDQGVQVSTRQRKVVHLEYDCVSPRVGSTQNVPLRIRILFHEQWDASKGETVLRPDYLAIAHSAALAVAKELRCVDDGGLPARAEDLPAAD
ncbi:hypothetical protein ACIRBY_36210 [Streptomyces sp. NPDC096136]|uniref:hypothetical protein n=1 Tax=Streptomyces sp. NPDC096136 TaxID=3366076 RepID=UPI0037F2D258